MGIPKDELKNRLRSALNLQNMKAIELSEKTGIPKSAISQYMSGYAKPKQDRIYLLARALNVSEAWLMGYDVPMERTGSKPRKKGVKIPVLGEVIAGVPIEAIEDILDYEEISEDMASKGEYFGLKVKGDSMEPMFFAGDIVIVRQQPTADSGDIVIALVNGDESTIKKLKLTDDGLMLIPANPAYEPMYYTRKQVMELPDKKNKIVYKKCKSCLTCKGSLVRVQKSMSS